MVTVTLSPKYQVVIPKEIRTQLALKPGMKLQILRYGERLEFVLVKKASEMKGFLKGIDTSVDREDDRL
ncbi:MAG: AbrB/MazE/SpoVT family DNA-binding domain-containing protein [Candidatus Marinimicrobia bacterium]|nr:AbrB/MazE/SpoVT family DNA-binding domain-containing protein [Candidatus Neomarinimicrobiota bacterium]MCF7923297.1 AbrB/MazE/SpoVT family DNA-binding domain-containing protein [Candidatus Neomarinimicrobiota bacterium]